MKKQSGVALLFSIFFVILFSAIAVKIQYSAYVNSVLSKSLEIGLQKTVFEDTIFNWAQEILLDDVKKTESDSLNEPWSIEIKDLSIQSFFKEKMNIEHGKASTSGKIIDLNRKFNAYKLIAVGLDELNPYELVYFKKILKNVSVEDDRISALSDKLKQNMATTSQYSMSAMSYVEWCRHFYKSFTPDEFLKIKDIMTCYYPQGNNSININTAVKEVLEAYFDQSTASRIINERNKKLISVYNGDFENLFPNHITKKIYFSSVSDVFEVTVSLKHDDYSFERTRVMKRYFDRVVPW